MKKAQFGGDWTEEKLECVRKYLSAYTTIMSKQPFRFAYIDGFAGTGYRIRKPIKKSSQPTSKKSSQSMMFPEMCESEVQKVSEVEEILDGSPRVALEVEPPFHKYIFVEKNKARFSELQQLEVNFPKANIEFVQDEANAYLQKLCSSNWLRSKRRAVLFLDPYGMAVKWETIKAIANTKAIDLWLLFPSGIAVNRLLRKDGQIDEGIRETFDQFLGALDWFNQFYEVSEKLPLFKNDLQKVANLDSIEQYFIERLKSVFTKVAENPLRLCNSKNSQMYSLCFAAGNPKGASTAVKIAQYILKR